VGLGWAMGVVKEVQPLIARDEAKKDIRRPVNAWEFNIMALACEMD